MIGLAVLAASVAVVMFTLGRLSARLTIRDLRRDRDMRWQMGGDFQRIDRPAGPRHRRRR
jgi:hypothetical protein